MHRKTREWDNLLRVETSRSRGHAERCTGSIGGNRPIEEVRAVLSGATTTASRDPSETPTEGQSASSGPTDQQSPSGLPLDEVFGILSNERRRQVLDYMQTAEEPVSLSDLAEEIAANENDKPVRHLSSQERKRAYVGLYQVHLPKMDGMDIVEFNKPRGLVETGENASIFDEYLDSDEEGPGHRPWHAYYGGVSGMGLVILLLASWVGSVSAIPLVRYALIFVVGTFCLTSVAHYLSVRVEGSVADLPDVVLSRAP